MACLLPGTQPAKVAVTPRHRRKTPSFLIILAAQLKGLVEPHFSHWRFVLMVSTGKRVMCSASPAIDPANI